jgi:hypothetical protein
VDRSGEFRRGLQPPLDSGFEILRADGQEVAGQLRNAAFGFELRLQLPLGGDPVRHIAIDENRPNLPRGADIRTSRELHPAPCSVLVPITEAQQRDRFVYLGSGVDLLHLLLVVGMDVEHGVLPQHLLGLVSEGLREARAHVDQATILCDLGDRVRGVFGEGAEPLLDFAEAIVHYRRLRICLGAAHERFFVWPIIEDYPRWWILKAQSFRARSAVAGVPVPMDVSSATEESASVGQPGRQLGGCSAMKAPIPVETLEGLAEGPISAGKRVLPEESRDVAAVCR